MTEKAAMQDIEAKQVMIKHKAACQALNLGLEAVVMQKVAMQAIEAKEVMMKQKAAMQAIQAWLRANPDKAPAIMQRNNRYIIFRKLETDGPVGASGVVLTPGRSIAASPEMQTGLPIWLEAGTGSSSRSPPIRRLVMVQDLSLIHI